MIGSSLSGGDALPSHLSGIGRPRSKNTARKAVTKLSGTEQAADEGMFVGIWAEAVKVNGSPTAAGPAGTALAAATRESVDAASGRPATRPRHSPNRERGVGSIVGSPVSLKAPSLAGSPHVPLRSNIYEPGSGVDGDGDG